MIIFYALPAKFTVKFLPFNYISIHSHTIPLDESPARRELAALR
jgi:hypothetical protein